jgi:hypothetical protein
MSALHRLDARPPQQWGRITRALEAARNGANCVGAQPPAMELGTLEGHTTGGGQEEQGTVVSMDDRVVRDGGRRGRGRGSRGGRRDRPRSLQFTAGLEDSASGSHVVHLGTGDSTVPGESQEVPFLGAESHLERGSGRRQRCARGSLRLRKPRNWTAPEIRPTSASPRLLRQRSRLPQSGQSCPTCGGVYSEADKENPCRLWDQYYISSPNSDASGRGQRNRRARRGPGPASLRGSPLQAVDPNAAPHPLAAVAAVEVPNPPQRAGKEVAQGAGTSATASGPLTAEFDSHSPRSSDTFPGTEVEAGFITPPLASRPYGPSQDSLAVLAYLRALSHYSSIDDDSEDTSWMADFQDFTGMDSSDDANSDWILGDDSLGKGEEDIDLEDYVEYRYVDVDQRAALDRVRYVYRDSEWGDSSHPELQGDSCRFRGPHPGPTQRYTRNRPTARSFFDLWWVD